MNSQRADNNKNKVASAVFTKETLGVVIVLFATLCLVCLITRDAVFSVPGKAIGDFLTGAFGVFAYPLVLFALFKGVMLVIDKKINISFKRKTLAVVSVILIALFMHVVSMGAYETFGEYVSASYSRADGAFSAGGAVAGVLTYSIFLCNSLL